jgi:hypothetical protein
MLSVDQIVSPPFAIPLSRSQSDIFQSMLHRLIDSALAVQWVHQLKSQCSNSFVPLCSVHRPTPQLAISHSGPASVRQSEDPAIVVGAMPAKQSQGRQRQELPGPRLHPPLTRQLWYKFDTSKLDFTTGKCCRFKSA